METKEQKHFTVTLEITAPSKRAVERMLEGMPHAERIWDDEIVDEDDRRFECRIRYDENYCGEGEHFVFENKWTDEEEWGLDSAFPLVNFENGKIARGEGELIHYTALTKIRELMHLGVHFYFSSK